MRAVLQNLRRLLRPPVPPRPLILMYHRVADPAVDPWGLAVTPRHFDEHVEVLRRSRRPLPLPEFVEKLDRGALPGDAVAVTFDDGYVDNLRAAKPRLSAGGVPATVFVTTGAVGQRTEYWWDELARGLLDRTDPLDCEVMIGTEPCRISIPATDPAQDRRWRAWEAPPSERAAAYLAVWRRLRDQPAWERSAAMSRLRKALNAGPPDPNDLPMTASEIAELAAGGLIHIGAHTVTHPALPTLDPVQRRREILESGQSCGRLTGRPVVGFAYPHGALDADSRAAVRECGFLWACSTEPRAVPGRGYDRYALPRLSVPDSDGDAFGRMLQGAGA